MQDSTNIEEISQDEDDPNLDYRQMTGKEVYWMRRRTAEAKRESEFLARREKRLKAARMPVYVYPLRKPVREARRSYKSTYMTIIEKVRKGESVRNYGPNKGSFPKGSAMRLIIDECLAEKPLLAEYMDEE